MPPRSSSPQDLAAELLARTPSGPVALLFDYDGTLAEIAPTPGQAILDEGARSRLGALARLPRARVAIVTGRTRAGLLGVAGALDDLTVASNGGLHITDARGAWVHPRAKALIPALAEVAARMAAAVKAHPGASCEDKTLSFAVHFRLAPDAEDALAESLRGALAGHESQFRVVHGKKVFEVLPNLDWDKGAAVETLLERWGIGAATLFVGDDVIDEPAFRVVAARGGLAVRIGEARDDTAAEYVLADVAQAHRLMDALATALAS